jgi:dsDNA-specific endonuclease/ATPase MutS2
VVTWQFLNGKPTYRFREGAIGESYALEVAERLELPKEVGHHTSQHIETC